MPPGSGKTPPVTDGSSGDRDAEAERESPARDAEFLTTLERGLVVLRAFDRENPAMTLTQVTARTELNAAVVRRCLRTLVVLGYVAQTERTFLLRPEVLAFGSAYLASTDLHAVAGPQLQWLRDQTGDSASMAVLSVHDILYVAHVATTRRIRTETNIGNRFPLHATALGRAMLAYRDGREIDAYLGEAVRERFTPNTMVDAALLRCRLEEVRARGFDTALDELDYGILSIAVPVTGADGRVIAAINCSTTTGRVSQGELIETRLPLLQTAAAELHEAICDVPTLAASLASGTGFGSRGSFGITSAFSRTARNTPGD